MDINNINPAQFYSSQQPNIKIPKLDVPSDISAVPREVISLSIKNREEKQLINNFLGEGASEKVSILDYRRIASVAENSNLQKKPPITQNKNTDSEKAEKPSYNGYILSTPKSLSTESLEDNLTKNLFSSPQSPVSFIRDLYFDVSSLRNNNPSEANLLRNSSFIKEQKIAPLVNRCLDSKKLIQVKTPEQGEDKVAFENAFIKSFGIDKLHAQGLTGKGIGVCVIDSGASNHEDFGDRITAWKDFTTAQSNVPTDPIGHGTMVTGLLAGDGTLSDGKIMGVAPEVDIISARATSMSESILALQWAIENKDEYNIKVVNISMGSVALLPAKDDPWAQAVTKAVEAGIAVVVASGNDEPGGAVTTPGISPDAITVGAMNDRATIRRDDDRVAYTKSAQGYTKEGILKPDILAPGMNLFSACSPDSMISSGGKYNIASGSSLAAPIVSGLCALLLQANPNLTPKDLKTLLQRTSEPVNNPSDRHIGALVNSVINPEKSVELSKKLK